MRTYQSPYWGSSYFRCPFVGLRYHVPREFEHGDLETINQTLTDLFQHRGVISVGFNSGTTSVEAHGGQMVPILPWEPDPATFRSEHYYNSTLNTLFKRIVTANNPKIGKRVAHWKRISSPR